MSDKDFLVISSHISRIGQNTLFKKKYLISNYQTTLNLFHELLLKKKKKKTIIFILIQTGIKFSTDYSWYFLYMSTLVKRNQTGNIFEWNDIDSILTDKIYEKLFLSQFQCLFFSFISNRLFSKNFLYNFLIELEFFFEDKITFLVFQNDLFRIVKKTFLTILSLMGDQSIVEHFLSFSKTRQDFLGDFFGLYMEERNFFGNQISSTDCICELFEFIRVKIKYRYKLIQSIENDCIPNVCLILRKISPLRNGMNKILLKKKKKESKLQFGSKSNFKNLQKKNKKSSKKNLFLKLQNCFFFLFNWLKKYYAKFQILTYFQNILIKNWFQIFTKPSHFWSHILLYNLSIFVSKNQNQILKTAFWFSNLFFSKIKVFSFCLGNFLRKIISLSHSFSLGKFCIMSETIVSTINNSFFSLKKEKVFRGFLNLQNNCLLYLIFQKIKMSSSLHFIIFKIPKIFLTRGGEYFKKKNNYLYLKYVNKVILEEKDYRAQKKFSAQMKAIFKHKSSFSFSLFLFSVLIPIIPVSSQILILEQNISLLKNLIDTCAKKFTGIRTLFLINLGYPCFNFQMFQDKLNSYDIIDPIYLGRGIVIERFIEKNNLVNLLEILTIVRRTFEEKKFISLTDQKFLKIHLKQLTLEKRLITQKGYFNLKKVKFFFYFQIQNFDAIFLESLNIFLNQIFYLSKSMVFFSIFSPPSTFIHGFLKYFFLTPKIFSFKNSKIKYCCINLKKLRYFFKKI